MASCFITIAMLATMSLGVSADEPNSVLRKYDITVANNQSIVLSPEENEIMLGYLNSESPDSPFKAKLSARNQVTLSSEEFIDLLVDIGMIDGDFLNDMSGKVIEINNPTGLFSIREVKQEQGLENDKARASYTRTDQETVGCFSCAYQSTIKLTSRFTNGTDSIGAYQDNTSNTKSNTASSSKFKRVRLSNESIHSDRRTYTPGDVSRAIYEYDYSCDHDTNSSSLMNQSNPVR